MGEIKIHVNKLRIQYFFSDNAGIAQPVIGMFGLLFVIVMMVFVLNIAAYKSVSDKLEDALAASGLAASLIDIRQYGIDHSMVISDGENAYEKYKETLEINLGLTDGRPERSSLISGPVTINVFRIYNVEGEKVTEIEVSGSGARTLREGNLGEVRAPDGTLIELTGIYSEVSFPIKSKWGVNVTAHKSKLTSVDTV